MIFTLLSLKTDIHTEIEYVDPNEMEELYQNPLNDHRHIVSGSCF